MENKKEGSEEFGNEQSKIWQCCEEFERSTIRRNE